MRSLFIVSLPRSLSTHIYEQCTITLKLQFPQWVDAGEILNRDRYLILKETGQIKFTKFTQAEDNFVHMRKLLDDKVQPTGYIYKDVVQPFIVSRWLKTNQMPVLRIKRPIADVSLSMIRKGWLYPSNAAPTEKDITRAVIQGLLKAEQALNSLPTEVVEFDALLENETALQTSLQKLYPTEEIPPFHYRNDLFLQRKQEVQALRFKKEWLELDHLVTELSAGLQPF